MKNKFKKYIEDNDLIKRGDRIVVGLSGGPDSVCLLHLLHSIQEEYDLKVCGAHINHMLRGKEALKDEEYAKEFCKSLGVEFYSVRIDIEKLAKETGTSTETAGRNARYDFFNKVMVENGYNKVATAHNANDQAETILMRIMRGTGLEGLGGIPVKRDGIYIRPILNIEREDIEKYCKGNSLNPRIDKTNLEKIYSRNKIRLDILPYMKENFNKDIIAAINRMSLLLQEDNEYIKKHVDQAYSKFCIEKTDKIIIKRELFYLEKAILTRVLRNVLTKVSNSIYDFELKHINEVIGLKDIGTNKKIDLPNGIYAENVYGDIIVLRKTNIKKQQTSEISIYKEELDGKKVEFKNYKVLFKVENNEKKIKFNNNDLIKYFDYDKLNKYVTLRTRKNGDRIVPFGMHGSKKLKDIFIDMKIPNGERDSIPIVQFDEEVAWVVNTKLSNVYKINQDTKKVLKIIFERKE